MIIAVDGHSRGQGVGKKLVLATLEYLSEEGVDRCRTKTLATNHGVIRMYEGMGWIVRDRFGLIGRDYVTMVSGASLELGAK